MCDTIVAVKSATKNNKVIIAKNSDRYENEAHIVIKIPAKKHDLKEQPTVRVTHMEIPQVSTTNAVVLLKPEWLWGCEMGFNEYGLNIANEAVFTKEKHSKKTGLLGMDIMRLVLERCITPRESIDLIAKLIKHYGQGGNCKKKTHGKMYYHNSFIIADKDEAWVMETAGEFWVAKKVKDVYSISNRLTITSDYDLCHPDVIKNAISKGYCKDEKSFSFANCYSDFLYTKFACGKERRDYSLSLLEKDKGNLTVEKMKSILRTHSPKVEGKQFQKNTMTNICMHGGNGVSNQTTGSYVGELSDKCNYYITGSSTPCISFFKPFWFDCSDVFFEEGQRLHAIDYWLKHEKVHRLILENRIDYHEYQKCILALEQELAKELGTISIDTAPAHELQRLSKYYFEKDLELVEQLLSSAKETGSIKGSFAFNRFWSKMNKKLKHEVY